MNHMRVYSRKSDGRIELTNIIKNFTTAKDTAYFNFNVNGNIAIYRNTDDGYINSQTEKKPNIENRFFFTPKRKKSYYTISIGRNYIYIA